MLMIRHTVRLAAAGLAVLAAEARAHETAAALGALSLGEPPLACEALPQPSSVDRVRTSIGLVTARDDGTWALGCPSQLGDNATSIFASTRDGRLVGGIATGVLSVSTDGGCHFARVELPASDAFAYEVVGGGDELWALARQTATAWLLRIDRSGVVEVIASFAREGEGALTPDAVAPVEGSGAALLLAGARPTPRVQRLSGIAGEPPLADLTLPAGEPGLQRLAPRGVDAAGRVWLAATDSRGRWLATLDEARGELVEQVAPVESLHGPVFVGAQVIALAAGQLWSGTETLAPAAAVPWKCLQQLDDRVFACNLYELLEVVDVAAALAGGAGTVAVFATSQIGPPDNTCGRDADTATVCDRDWQHYGAENYWLDRTPAVCPDGVAIGGEGSGSEGSGAEGSGGSGSGGEGSGDPGASEPAGCAAAGARAVSAAPLLLAFALVRSRRRWR
jgi:hypothetical protein